MSTAKFDTISTLDGTKSISTYRVTQGVAAAWVNFNGTGTVAIRAAYNVSSITDNSTGDYTLNFTNALPDENYAVTSIVELNSGLTDGAAVSVDFGSRLTSSVSLICEDVDGSFKDYPAVMAIIFR